MEKKKTYLYIYVCMAALLFVGAAISLSVGSAEIGIIGSIKLAAVWYSRYRSICGYISV